MKKMLQDKCWRVLSNKVLQLWPQSSWLLVFQKNGSNLNIVMIHRRRISSHEFKFNYYTATENSLSCIQLILESFDLGICQVAIVHIDNAFRFLYEKNQEFWTMTTIVVLKNILIAWPFSDWGIVFQLCVNTSKWKSSESAYRWLNSHSSNLKVNGFACCLIIY